MTMLLLEEAPSPIGGLLLAWHDDALVGLEFADCEARLWPLLRRRFGAFATMPHAGGSAAARRLAAYFAGDLQAIDRIAVDPGGTPFQRMVWEALRQIPAGVTVGYGELAVRIGRPAAARATGAANGRNPIAIVIPCHRLVGKDGELTGYGGGIERKAWLLRHESAA